MQKTPSAKPARNRTRFCFVTLTVDHRRFDSVELATEAGMRQLLELLDFLREKKAEIRRSVIDEAASLKHWHVLFSADRSFSGAEVDEAWGLGRVNVLNWVDFALAEKYLLNKREA